MTENTIEEGDRILVDCSQLFDHVSCNMGAEVYRVKQSRDRPYRIIDERGSERWVSRENIVEVADPDTEVNSNTEADTGSTETGTVELTTSRCEVVSDSGGSRNLHDSVDLRQTPCHSRTTDRVVCPHCGNLLPVDEYTECDQCGAHLKLCVKTVAPPQEIGLDGGNDG